MKYIVTLNQKKYEVEVERVSPFHMLTHEEVATGVKAAPAPVQPAAPVQTAAPVATPAASGSGTTVNSPMPGTILEVKTAVGQSVKSGQTLFIMEAMKMETEIVAPADGVVASIAVKSGDITETDQVLATLS
ncbi:MAG: biotin/lipoyl-containing protein [Clostridium sp.]|uniref:biotin/lipoyl-containing protein n=1 Tax=Clostridium culturomicium TaxID=1499683 RepID=UPI00058B581E|nr:biotin/lipoyl-containing protein [Clostridium culturomicium]MDU4892199.1 biotin/lipoyl-containing protein [Clostridium sp.]MDU7082586.1 biotin/lipoyl-containing protein [Clostridium sp.]